jgi:hypothetical protein
MSDFPETRQGAKNARSKHSAEGGEIIIAHGNAPFSGSPLSRLPLS